MSKKAKLSEAMASAKTKLKAAENAPEESPDMVTITFKACADLTRQFRIAVFQNDQTITNVLNQYIRNRLGGRKALSGQKWEREGANGAQIIKARIPREQRVKYRAMCAEDGTSMRHDLTNWMIRYVRESREAEAGGSGTQS